MATLYVGEEIPRSLLSLATSCTKTAIKRIVGVAAAAAKKRETVQLRHCQGGQLFVRELFTQADYI
jgi:hypothetical protein